MLTVWYENTFLASRTGKTTFNRATFTLIILSKSLLYGAVHCNTQELGCETINIFFNWCQRQAVFERRYTKCRILRWPITAMTITRRKTVNKKNLTNQKVLHTYKKGLPPYKQDLLRYTKKRIALYIQKTHGK